MKYLPLIAATAVLAACANQPLPAGTQTVGQSQQAPTVVAQCIAQKWADRSQQQVISQTMLANDLAVDVYVPGQQPPNGSAAVVRPAWASSNAHTWVGFHSNGGAGGDATGDISACL